MLEGLLAQLLDRILGKYVDGIDSKAARMSVWSGHISLKDLKLKKSALDDFDLPAKLKFGHLEELKLDIPWKNLRSKPVSVKINGLYIVLAAHAEGSLSAEEKALRERDAKRAMIGELDAAGPQVVPADGAESFSARLATKVVDNIQIDISNIHIRYEDCINDSRHQFAFGIMLSRFAAESTDTNWKPSFVENQKVLFKLASLRGLSVYCNSDQKPLDGGMETLLGDDFAEKLKHMVRSCTTEEDPDSMQSYEDLGGKQSAHDPIFIVRPIDATCKIKMNKSDLPNPKVPKYDIGLEMSRVALQLEKRQYRDLIRTLDFVGNFERICRYNQFRPSLSPREAPKEWWKFAFRCITWEREQRMLRFDKQKLFNLMLLWPRYARLFKRRYASTFGIQELNEHETGELQKMEDELPIEAITTARDAIHQLLKVRIEELETAKLEEQKENPKGGFYSMMSRWVPTWGGKSEGGDGGKGAGGYGLTRAEAQQQLMLEMGIEDETGGEEMQEAKDVDTNLITRIQMSFLLHSGSLTMLSHSDQGVEIPITRLTYRNVRMLLTQKPATMEFTMQLATFVVYDLFTPNLAPGFHRIVSRHVNPPSDPPAKTFQAFAAPANMRVSERAEKGAAGWGLTQTLQALQGWSKKYEQMSDDDTPVLSFSYQSNPQDSDADSRVTLKLESMSIVYNVKWVAALNDFLDVGVSPAVEAMKKSAQDQLEQAKARSEQNLKSALQAKLVMDLFLDLQSPVIYVPVSLDAAISNSPLMVLKPGNLSLWTLKSHLPETSDLLQKMVSVDELDDRYYNTLLFELSGVQMLVAPREQAFAAASSKSGNKEFDMIDDIRISLCIDNSIAPSNPSLTRTKLKMALPQLNLNFSRKRYHALLEILAVNTGGGDSPPPPPDQQSLHRDRRLSSEGKPAQVGQATGRKTANQVPGRKQSSAAVQKHSDRKDRSRKSSKQGNLSDTEIEQNTVEPEVAAEWKHLDVSIWIAPHDPISLKLSDEDVTPSKAIADMNIRNIRINYITFGDGSSKIEAAIAFIEAVDARPDTKNCFRRLIAPKDKTDKFFSVQAETTKDGASDYAIWIGHLDMILIPEALYPIAGVFQGPQNKEAATQNSEPKAAAPQDNHSTTMEVMSVNDVPRAPAAKQEQKGTVYRVFVVLPTVTLIEAFDNPSSRRLTMQLSFMARHAYLPDGSQEGLAHLQDLRLFVHEDSPPVEKQILERCSLSVEYEFAADGGSRLWMMAREVDLKVSYENLKLLFTLYRTLLPEDSPASDEQPNNLEISEEISEIMSSASVKILETQKSVSGSIGQQPNAPSQIQYSDKHYRIDFGTFKLTVVNDCAGFNQPFASLDFKNMSALSVANTHGDEYNVVHAQTVLSLFNHKIMEYEPVMEEWSVTAETSVKRSVAAVIESGVKCHGAIPSSVEMYKISSSEILNFNVTESHMSSIVSTLTAWQKDWDHFTASAEVANSEDHTSKASAHSAYQIQNRCGLPLGIRTVSREANKRGTLSQVVQPLDTQPLVLEERFWSMSNCEGDSEPTNPKSPRLQSPRVRYPPPIYISHEENVPRKASANVSSDIPGFMLAVHESSTSICSLGDGTKVLAHVQTEKESASHILTVHSQLAVCNECQVPLNVALTLIDGSQVYSSKIEAGNTVDVPPHNIQDNLFSLRVAAQPAQSADAPWTDAAVVAEDLDIVINSQVIDADQNESVEFFVRVVARTRTVTTDVGEQFDIVSVCFLPVIVVNNLLPCPICFSFLLEDSDTPIPSYLVESGEEIAIHDFSLSQKVNIGFSLGALSDSEFVPVFCPDGSALETHVNLFDANKDLLRLQLEHEQQALQTFRVAVFAPYWFVNRTGFPLAYGQKWTASNVTMLGGQNVDENGEFSHLCMREILSGSHIRPHPFSFHFKTDVGGAKATVRLSGKYKRYSSRDGKMVPCDWCSAFTIDSVGSSSAIELAGEGFTVDAVIQVTLGEKNFRRTKVITVLPRYVVCNNVTRPIELGQVGCENADPRTLQKHDIVVVKWLDESKDRRVGVRLLPDRSVGHEDWHWEWSGGIIPQTVGYSPLKVRAGKLKEDGTHEVFNLMVHAAMNGLVTVLTVHEQNENPAILVQNDSKWAGIAFRQAGVSLDKEEKTSPGEAAGYCWDDPHAPPVFEVRIEDGSAVQETTSCNMDRLGKFPTLRVGDKTLNISVVARGPTKVLHITDGLADGSAVSERYASVEQSLSSDMSVGVRDDVRPADVGNTVTHYNVDLAGVGVSIIDSTPQELIYLSLLGLSLKSVKAGDWELNQFHLQRFQIDNQTLIGPPVLLGQGAMSLEEYEQRIAAQERGHPISADISVEEATAQMDEDQTGTSTGRKSRNEEFFSVKVSKNLKNPSLDCYDLVDVSFSDTSISCDEKVLIQLLKAFSGILAKLAPPADAKDNAEQAAEQVGRVGAIDLSNLDSDRSSSAMRWTYIESLRISPIRVFITFTSSDDASGLLDSLGPISKLPVFAFIEAAKAVITNVDRAPIILNNIDWDRPFLPQEELIQRITKHYTNNIMRGFYRLVGSLEFLGNPTGLVSNIGQGLHGFLDYSVEGFREGQVAKGLAYGAGSLTAGAVQGVFGSAAGLSGAMGKGLAQLTFDGDYKRARSLLDQDRPLHFGQGMYRGGKSFGRGILLGVTGIVMQPVKGFSRHGATGAIKGVGKGLVGVLVKPMAGVADLVSQTSEGIRNTPEYISKKGVITRVRLPRQWQAGTAVKGYDKRTALGVAMLTKLSLHEGWPVNEMLVEHAAWQDVVMGPVVLFITMNRMILCRRSRYTGSRTKLPHLTLCFAVSVNDIMQILEGARHIEIVFRRNMRQTQCLPAFGTRVAGCMNRTRNSCSWKLSLPDKEMHRWLLQRLRSMTMTDSSQLNGEDWLLLPQSQTHEGTNRISSGNSGAQEPIQDAGCLLNQLEIKLEGASLRGSHMVYKIDCSVLDFEEAAPTRSWTVYKRFSEFVRLRKAIVQEETSLSVDEVEGEAYEEVPALPAKRWFGRTSETVVNERVMGLQDFLLTLRRQSRMPARARLTAKFLMALQQGGNS